MSINVLLTFMIYFSTIRIEGWVVCEEHKDILLAAWDEEQEIIQEKEKEVREIPDSISAFSLC